MTTNQPLPDAHELGEVLQQFEAESDASLAEVRRLGLKVDLGPYLTIASYAKKYGVSTQVVSTWLKQGIIPASCVEELPKLNNIRLVKDQVYK